MPSVTVDVDVDLDDFDTDDLVDELEDRMERHPHPRCSNALNRYYEGGPTCEELYLAFSMGKTDEALELARKMAEAGTGRMLAR